MLTPASDDPNRKEELKRRKEDPAAFGSSALSPEDVAQRDFSKSGLVEDDRGRKSQKAAEFTEEISASWYDFLAQSVGDIIPQLGDLEVDQLVGMQEAELAGKSRVTLLSAIEEELTTR